MNTCEMILEFNKIKEMLIDNAVTQEAKKELSNLKPYTKEQDCQDKITETSEAKYILEKAGTPPLPSMKDIDKILSLCEKNSVLTANQLEDVAVFLSACSRIQKYMQKVESEHNKISYYGRSLCQLTKLQEEIQKSLQNGQVLSSASTKLRNIRRKTEAAGAQLKRKLEDLLRNKKQCFTDNYVSLRNGCYVLPVKKEYKNLIKGSVLDISATGSTYFIEPSATSKWQEDINLLELEEDNEIRKILYILTAAVESAIPEIRINMEAIIGLDILFSKAKLSIDMKAVPAEINTHNYIKIVQGRHPLLNQKECIPLDFSIGNGIRGIIITGPNTGGKTVALKTVGLLSMMVQCGLHVPVMSGSFCIFDLFLCDIGDGQSITENLSTFSSHIKNIISILDKAGRNSLVLLDELGSGTDPVEGMGIAVSILEELYAKGCLYIATTHYPEVKAYADKKREVLNARMAFDRESLKPLYQLEIGEAGESCALYIAKRLGFPQHMLERAYKEAYGVKYSNTVTEISPQAQEIRVKPEPESVIAASEPKEKKKTKSQTKSFQMGDSVIVKPDNNIGIVFQAQDKRGEVGVQIKGRKIFVNEKRLALKVPASELYPPDYDFSILFDSVENRKIRHQMERKHTPGLMLQLDNEGHKN